MSHSTYLRNSSKSDAGHRTSTPVQTERTAPIGNKRGTSLVPPTGARRAQLRGAPNFQHPAGWDPSVLSGTTRFVDSLISTDHRDFTAFILPFDECEVS